MSHVGDYVRNTTPAVSDEEIARMNKGTVIVIKTLNSVYFAESQGNRRFQLTRERPGFAPKLGRLEPPTVGRHMLFYSGDSDKAYVLRSSEVKEIHIRTPA